MAQPSLKARFFVTPDGFVWEKAPPLKQSFKWQFFRQSDQHCALCKRPVRFGGTSYAIEDPLRRQPGQVDHIFPRSRGGQNETENLQVLCLCCNSQKGSKEQWQVLDEGLRALKWS